MSSENITGGRTHQSDSNDSNGNEPSVIEKHENLDNDGYELRNSRIAARRERIKASRVSKTKTDNMEDSEYQRTNKTNPEKPESSKSQKQIAQSRNRIDNAKQTGVQDVTNIRVASVVRENQRRTEESKKLEMWEKKNEACAELADEMAKDIDKQWDSALEINGPYEIYDLLLKQKQACQDLIAAKDKLIIEYQIDLKKKDDEYVKELKRQAEEINQLLQKMDSQYKCYQKILREELQQIERAVMEERTDLIEKNVKEIESLFEMRRSNENWYTEERASRIEEDVNSLEDLRIQDAEEYNLIKIKLETDVQVLEQQLQQMKATYQLNTEKLEYNYQVLKKRDEENAIALNQQKRKITRLTDVLNGLKSKLVKQEKGYQQEYSTLTEDYKRLTEQFKELQKKFRHFQISDGKTFQDIWEMNEETVQELLRKILQADQIIHEQQLGMAWEPPSVAALAELSAPRNVQRATRTKKPKEDESHSKAQISNMTACIVTNNNKLIIKMLDLLCKEASFLVEEKLLKLLTPLSKEEQSLMKIDSIFKALSINTPSDIETLSKYFIRQHHHSLISSMMSDLNADDQTCSNTNVDVKAMEEDVDVDDVFIHPNEVVKNLKMFLDDVRGSRNGTETDHFVDRPLAEDERSNSDSDIAEGTVESEEKTSLLPGPQDEADQADWMRLHWKNLAKIIDEKNYRVWNSVLTAMDQYHLLLTRRHSISTEVTSLQSQNRELKVLLQGYMTDDVNNELEIPPSQVLMAMARE